MRYELIYLIGASEEANLEQIKKDVEKVITDFSGVFEEKEWTEKRKMAYQIGKDYQGTYFAKRFELENKESLAEINNQLRLLTQVSRFMIMKTDDIPEFDELEKKLAREKRATQENTSREEKNQKEVPAKKAEAEKVEKAENKTVSSQEEPEKDQSTSEDIDKKLEEILNI